MWRIRRRTLIMAMLLLVAAGCSSGTTTPASETNSPIAVSQPTTHPKHHHDHRHQRHRQPAVHHQRLPCPSSPLRGVYDSYRLQVLGTCRWFVGVVTRVEHEHDGDYHVDVRPGSAVYRRFLDSTNFTELHGSMVTEIMPGQHLPVPSVGEPVAVFGTWVLDSNHGWNEIHPIWAINYRDAHRLLERLPPRTPLYDSGATSQPSSGGGGSGGSNCTPGYSPCLVKHGGADYDCYGGGGNGPYFTAPGVTYTVTGNDPYGLDGNHDGRACG